MVDKTVVVTGANRRIGLAVARELVGRGCRVILVARDVDAAQVAVRSLSTPGAKPADVALVVGDLSSPTSTRAVASRLLEASPRIDVLIHNAGLWPSRLDRSDGLERAFAVNHLAPFLLNHLVAPAMPRGGRIVQVSAGLYVKGRVDLEKTPRGEDFHAIRTYATTKLCNLLLLRRFAERLRPSGITINALHPGVIRTGLGARAGPIGLLLQVVKLLWKAPEEGARPIVRLALDPILSDVSGKYFHLETETPLEAVADDDRLAAGMGSSA